MNQSLKFISSNTRAIRAMRTTAFSPSPRQFLTMSKMNHKMLAPTTMQLRQYQSPKIADNPTFLDTLVGTYEDSRYYLDLKPEEWREGQFIMYVYNKYAWITEVGVVIVAIPAAMAITLCFSMLAYYTMSDSQVSLARNNPHPYFSIRHGGDFNKIRNPLLMWAYPYGPHQDKKVHFYYEIRDAIERKNKAKLVNNGEF